MIKIKYLYPIAVVILFLSLAFAPTVSASGDNTSQLLEIAYSNNGGSYYSQLEIKPEKIELFTDSWETWENTLKSIQEDGKIDNGELAIFEDVTVSMLEDIRELSCDPAGRYHFPLAIDIASLIHNYFFMIGGGTRIISIGRGRVWLPLNRQGEAFIGMKLLPIFLFQSIGFTKVRSWSLAPLSISVSTRWLKHNVCTMRFTGLYINFGKRYLDRTAGPVILIGKTWFTGLSG